MVVIVVAVIGVLLLLLLASIGKSFSVFDDLKKAKHKAAMWQHECYCVVEKRDALQAENDRLKKAASKLVMQVAQDFGKDVTKSGQE